MVSVGGAGRFGCEAKSSTSSHPPESPAADGLRVGVGGFDGGCGGAREGWNDPDEDEPEPLWAEEDCDWDWYGREPGWYDDRAAGFCEPLAGCDVRFGCASWIGCGCVWNWDASGVGFDVGEYSCMCGEGDRPSWFCWYCSE